MIKKILFGLPCVLLAACGGGDGGNWSNDCWTYYSVNSRELSECKKRVEEGHLQEGPSGEVSIDKNNEERPTFKELGKERDSNAN